MKSFQGTVDQRKVKVANPVDKGCPKNQAVNQYTSAAAVKKVYCEIPNRLMVGLTNEEYDEFDIHRSPEDQS